METTKQTKREAVRDLAERIWTRFGHKIQKIVHLHDHPYEENEANDVTLAVIADGERFDEESDALEVHGVVTDFNLDTDFRWITSVFTRTTDRTADGSVSNFERLLREGTVLHEHS